MLLLRSLFIALRTSPPAFATQIGLGKVAHRQALGPILQAAPIVSVSGFGMERKPQAMVTCLFELPREQTIDKKLQYFSFHFSDDDEPANVAFVFTICEGDDLIEVLQRYALSMGGDTDGEYNRAFQSFVMRLAVGSLLENKRLQHQRAQKTCEIENEITPLRNSANGRTKTSDVPVKWAAGQARDEEMKLRLQQGRSFLDLTLCFETTPESIIREARRLLGKEGLQKIRKRNKRGQWSNEEIQWLLSLQKKGLTLLKITMLLRITKYRAEKQLGELRKAMFESVVVEGPQQPPPGLQESLCNNRLVKIW
jgi:hypothetical protein